LWLGFRRLFAGQRNGTFSARLGFSLFLRLRRAVATGLLAAVLGSGLEGLRLKRLRCGFLGFGFLSFGFLGCGFLRISLPCCRLVRRLLLRLFFRLFCRLFCRLFDRLGVFLRFLFRLRLFFRLGLLLRFRFLLGLWLFFPVPAFFSGSGFSPPVPAPSRP
jgi:hypothetical protein